MKTSLLFAGVLLSLAVQSASNAELVTGFNIATGTDAVVFTNTNVTVTATDVLTTNGQSDNSSGLLTTVDVVSPSAATSQTFSGVFQAASPLDLLFFDFAAVQAGGATGRFNVEIAVNGGDGVAGGTTFDTAGTFSTASPGVFSTGFNISDLEGVTFGEITLQLENAEVVEVPNLPNTGFAGFAAISGVAAVPEPSSFAMIAVAGFGVMSRRRRKCVANDSL